MGRKHNRQDHGTRSNRTTSWARKQGHKAIERVTSEVESLLIVARPTQPESVQPYVQMALQPKHERHYRSILLHPGPTGMAYVAIATVPQSVCVEHVFEHLDRFGHGTCTWCHALAWSRWWVAASLYGDDTAAWAKRVEAQWSEALNRPASAGGFPFSHEREVGIEAVRLELAAPAKRFSQPPVTSSEATVTPINA